MNEFDNVDIEFMLNHPFKNIDKGKDDLSPSDLLQKRTSDKIQSQKKSVSEKHITETDNEEIDQSCKSNQGIPNYEEKLINTEKKLETLKNIIEHQNSRINLLEEEFEILRAYLKKDSDDSISNNSK